MLECHYLENDALLVGRPRGVLDVVLATELIDMIAAKEASQAGDFNRYCDLSCVEAIRLTMADIEELAQRRRNYPRPRKPVKAALLVTSPLAYGIVHMYKVLLKGFPLTIKTFTSIRRAAEWLGIEVKEIDFGAGSTSGTERAG